MPDDFVTDIFGDLEFSEEERKVLAKRVICVFASWGLTTEEQSMALGLSGEDQSSFSTFADGQPVAQDRELLWRIGNILAIFRLLRSFDIQRPDRADRWISTPNASFDGAKPIDLLKKTAGFVAVRACLEAYGAS